MKNKRSILGIIVFIYSFLFGQSIEELQRMKNEYELSQKSLIQNPSPGFIQPSGSNPSLPQEAIIQPLSRLNMEEQEVDTSIHYFGYNFFTSRDQVSFWENLPTPANYVLGPGDELVISLWGETQIRGNYIISRDGKIYVEKVGLLNLAGKNIENAKMYLRGQFSRVYATLKGPNPKTYMDVSLGELRSINVNFVGEVSFPGIYPVHPFSTVITGLIQAGGVDSTGSLRNIQIKRDGKISTNVDLYDYLLKGNLPENIQLRNQDVVVVPVRMSTINIDSAVVRPGIYEAKPGETIHQMIDYAGGLKMNASTIIGLKRFIPIEKRISKSESIENYYIEFDDAKNTLVRNGDVINLHSIFNTMKQVEIIGQVKNPGSYYFFDGMRIKDLIALGGGFSDSTYLKSIYFQSAELIRRDPSKPFEQVIEVSLNNIINGGSSDNLKLQNLDRFVIHANRNYFKRKNVQILGEVNIPGYYPLLKNNESLQSIINRAGGLTSRALDNGISIYRDKFYYEDPPKDKILLDIIKTNTVEEENISKKPKIDDKEEKIKLASVGLDITLLPGDSIMVKEKTGTVYVTGEVYNSGLVEYQKGKSLKYYVNSAGGTNNFADRRKIIVIYPNGITVPYRMFRSPRITDGVTIVVYRKADQTPFNVTQFAETTVSLLTSLVTIMVLTKQLGVDGG